MSASHGTRRRPLQFFDGVSLGTTYTAPIFTTPGKYTEYPDRLSIEGMQETTSWDTLWPVLKDEIRATREGKRSGDRSSMLNRLRRLDVGGDFLTYKHTYTHSHPWVKASYTSGLNTYTYAGPIFAHSAKVGPKSGVWPVTTSLPQLDELMRIRGTTAIARSLPTNPVASAAQFLGELRERLPSVPGSRLIGTQGTPAAKLADEYLNIEFGLKPMLNDLKKFQKAIRSQNEVLSQLRRDSGRLVRRRYAFPLEVEVIESDLGTRPPSSGQGLNTYLYENQDPNGRLKRVRTISRQFTFSGAFTYYYNDGQTVFDKLVRAEQASNKLFGVRVSPELIWELAPWSWAADWVSNTGDVLHNLSAFSRDGLVMVYGYMMCHEIISDQYTLSGVKLRGLSDRTLIQTFTSEVKRRIRATPYGFGLDPASFSSRQWAILAALGISRASR